MMISTKDQTGWDCASVFSCAHSGRGYDYTLNQYRLGYLKTCQHHRLDTRYAVPDHLQRSPSQ